MLKKGKMLYNFEKKDLSRLVDEGRIFYGEGRGETASLGKLLHIPLKKYTAGSAKTEDHHLALTLANNLIEYLLYKRPVRGSETWDYDEEKASETYQVCGDNPTTSGIVIFDTSYRGGPKLHISLETTFGANEISVRWENGMVGDDSLLTDYMDYLKQAFVTGESSSPEP